MAESQQVESLAECIRLLIVEAAHAGIPKRTISTLLVGFGTGLAIDMDGFAKARSDLVGFADRLGTKR